MTGFIQTRGRKRGGAKRQQACGPLPSKEDDVTESLEVIRTLLARHVEVQRRERCEEEAMVRSTTRFSKRLDELFGVHRRKLD